MTNAVNIAGLGAALTVSSNVVNFSSTPTVAGSPIGASAATQTTLGTVYGETESSGASTTALGYQAFNASSTGTLNTAVGWQALTANTSGNNNTAVGEGALTANTTGSENVAVGLRSLYANQTGSFNTACGRNALRESTSSNNTAVGYQALGVTVGLNHVAVGSNALASYVGSGGGEGNCALGNQAGQQMTSGAWNIMVGAEAGKNLLGGNFSVLIGMKTQGSTTSDTDFMVISAGYINAGTGAVGKGNNTGYIVPGSGGMYQGNNSSSWSTTSDRRLKKNIVDNTEGLDIISQIRVRNFEYRLPEEVDTELAPTCAIAKTGVQLGVIAQELQQVCSDCVKEESTGVLAVDSDNILWHMVNAIKDLKALNDTLTARITALEAR